MKYLFILILLLPFSVFSQKNDSTLVLVKDGRSIRSWKEDRSINITCNDGSKYHGKFHFIDYENILIKGDSIPIDSIHKISKIYYGALIGAGVVSVTGAIILSPFNLIYVGIYALASIPYKPELGKKYHLIALAPNAEYRNKYYKEDSVLVTIPDSMKWPESNLYMYALKPERPRPVLINKYGSTIILVGKDLNLHEKIRLHYENS
jgi:hypothetical protein